MGFSSIQPVALDGIGLVGELGLKPWELPECVWEGQGEDLSTSKSSIYPLFMVVIQSAILKCKPDCVGNSVWQV